MDAARQHLVPRKPGALARLAEERRTQSGKRPEPKPSGRPQSKSCSRGGLSGEGWSRFARVKKR